MKTSSAAADTADLLHSLAVGLLRRARTADDATGLGAARLSALSVLVYGGPHTLGELAGVERVSLPTMTRIASALTRLGYARREPVERDRRFVRLYATERGGRLLQAGRENRIRRLETVLDGLSAADLDVCDQAAKILSAALNR